MPMGKECQMLLLSPNSEMEMLVDVSQDLNTLTTELDDVIKALKE